MMNVLAVFRRELSSSFDSPLAYIVVPVFLGLVATFTLWFQDLFAQGVVSLRGFFFWSSLFFVVLVPAITMRLFAEERRTGSLELLVTLPISDLQVVLGKYLSALALLLVALALTVTYPISMATLGELDWGPVLGGYLGLLMLGAALCGIGLAASALTANQVVAFLLAMVLCLLPFAIGFFLHKVPAGLLPAVQYMSFDYHLGNLTRGVLDSRDLIYFTSVGVAGLAVAVLALRHRRLS
jgi:ABC-2 type transport system permease protein